MERSQEPRADDAAFAMAGRSSDVEELAALIASVFRLEERDSHRLATAVYAPELQSAA